MKCIKEKNYKMYLISYARRFERLETKKKKSINFDLK